MVVGLNLIDDDTKTQVIQKTTEWHDLWVKQCDDPENPQHFPPLLTKGVSLADEAAQWASEIMPGTD
eukprot:12840071-Alexandrium_andersonii.AAC.1